MSETVSLAEIAKDFKVSRSRVKELFERGGLLEFVPRPQDPNAKWTIYRKDYERAVAMKMSQLQDFQYQWDSCFSLDAISLD